MPRKRRDHSLSRTCYDKALALTAAIAAETGAVEDRCELARRYEMLGSGVLRWNKRKSAKYYFTKSLSHREAIVKETGSAEARRALAAVYQRLGLIAAASREPSGSIQHLTKCLELQEGIAKETGAAEDRRMLAETYRYLGDVSESMRRVQEAKGYYLKNLELQTALLDASRTYESDCEYQQALSIMAWIATDPSEKRNYLQREYELLTQMVTQYPDREILQTRRESTLKMINSIK